MNYRYKEEKTLNGEVSKENLYHFKCGDEDCGKWWSIRDADLEKKVWYCHWCGKEQKINIKDYLNDNS